MASTKTTTTVEYPVSEFESLIRESIFQGKQVKIEFVIREVGGDPLDRFPGREEVVAVRVIFDGDPYS